MPLFFERFPRVLIDETSSSVRIFGALRWGVIYLAFPYSELMLRLRQLAAAVEYVMGVVLTWYIELGNKSHTTIKVVIKRLI